MIEEGTLDRVPFLEELNPAARRELAARAVLRRFQEGEELWRTGGAPRGLLIVLEGEVRVVRSSGGRQHVIHTEGVGGTLGEVPFFAEGTYPATAMATRPTLCIVLSRDAIVAAVREDPDLAFAFLRRLSRRVRALVDRLDRHVVKSVRARLADYLLQRASTRPAEAFTLGATQAEVAAELGTVREVVVRSLRELRKEGVLTSTGRGSYRVLDQDALKKRARDNG